MSVMNKCLALIGTLQTRLDALEQQNGMETVGKGGLQKNAQAQSSVNSMALETQTKRIDTLETTVRDLTRNISDLRTTLAQCRDDIGKDRSLVETSVMFKVEQFMNRSIKERIDHSMQDLKMFTENRCSDVETGMHQKVQQMFFEHDANVKKTVDASVADVRTQLTTQITQLSSQVQAATTTVASVPFTAIAPNKVDIQALNTRTPSPTPSPPTIVESTPEPSTNVSEPTSSSENENVSSLATTASGNVNDFSAGRRKIIRGPRKF